MLWGEEHPVSSAVLRQCSEPCLQIGTVYFFLKRYDRIAIHLKYHIYRLEVGFLELKITPGCHIEKLF